MGRYRKPFTLYKRGDYWYYRTYDDDGYRTTAKTTGQTTKTNAMNYCNELFKKGLLNVASITLSEYADGFYDENSIYAKDRAVDIVPKTLKKRKRDFSKYVLPAFGNCRLSDITFSAVKKFRQKLTASLSNSTVNAVINAFSIVLKYALQDGKISKNPCMYLTALPVDRDKDSFKRSEIIAMCKNVPETYKTFFMFMALTGCRISEAWGVTKADLKNENGTYYIDLQRQRIKHYVYTPLKNKKPRIIPLAPECVCLLDEPFNFTRTDLYESFPLWIKDIESAKERKLTMHSVRHFFVTDTKAKNVNPLVVETIAGHSLKGIQSVYTNYHLEDLTPIIEWQKELYAEMKKAALDGDGFPERL